MTPKRSPIIFCLSAPVAGGKSTLARSLSDADAQLMLSISTTSRAPRAGDVDGRDYFFVTAEEFLARKAQGKFLESTLVSGNYYGIERKNIQRAAATGCDLLLTIDFVGAQFLKREYPDYSVVIYLAPPSLATLEERIAKRGDTSAELIQNRLAFAETEMKALDQPGLSDYKVVNDDLATALDALKSIISAERHRLSRFTSSSDLRL